MSPPGSHSQDTVLRHSLENPEEFWASQAERLVWHKKPSSTLQRTTKTIQNQGDFESWAWFPDGEISTCYNCVDRHVLAGNGDAVAIIYDSPVTGVKKQYTYVELLDEVEVLAGALRADGVQKGDVVMFYMPMPPSSASSR
jgi:propionyl-CoA synthetase